MLVVVCAATSPFYQTVEDGNLSAVQSHLDSYEIDTRVADKEGFLTEERRFFLEEQQCNLNPVKTYITVLNSNKRHVGQFSNNVWTWNNDLVLTAPDKRIVTKTNIKSLMRLRKEINILDGAGALLVRAEQGLGNKLANVLLRTALASQTGIEIESPARSYTIYDAAGNEVGISRKIAGTGTTIEIFNSQGTLIATANKPLVDKMLAVACVNSVWTIEIFDHSATIDPRVVATLVAQKAYVDIQAAAAVKWEALNAIVKVLEAKDNKDL